MTPRSYVAVLAISLAFVPGLAAAEPLSIEELRAAIDDDRARIAHDREDVARLKEKAFDEKMSHNGSSRDRIALTDAQIKLDRDKRVLHDHKKALKQAKKAQQTPG